MSTLLAAFLPSDPQRVGTAPVGMVPAIDGRPPEVLVDPFVQDGGQLDGTRRLISVDDRRGTCEYRREQ